MDDFNRRFVIGDLLGSGGEGDVYSASNKSWAAIKIIELDIDDDLDKEIVRAQQEREIFRRSQIFTIRIYIEKCDEHNRIYKFKVYDRYSWSLKSIIKSMRDIRQLRI